MDNDGQGPSRNAGKPEWFINWLKEVFLPASKDPVDSQIKKFEDAVERIPDIDDAVKASLTNALTTEARISLVKTINQRYPNSSSPSYCQPKNRAAPCHGTN